MIGINKVTPSRAIQAVKKSSKNKERKAPGESVKSSGSKDKDAETGPSVRHIDERI